MTVFLSSVAAQDSLEIKYEAYRDRLLTCFMVPGTAQGENLIASQIGHGKERNIIKFGDQTIKLGFWLATLATEYQLNARKGVSNEGVVEQLYLTLYALNRLDLHAETRYRLKKAPDGPFTPKPEDLNGFLCRDDVPADFLKRYPNRFQELPFDIELTVTESDWIANEPYPAEMSKDQAIYVMMGLACIARFIPEEVNYKDRPFQDGASSLVQEAGNIMERIMGYLSRGPQDRSQYPWILRNPVTEEEVPAGGNLMVEAWPITRAALHAFPDRSKTFKKGYGNRPIAKIIWRHAWLGSTFFRHSHINAPMWTLLKVLANDFNHSTHCWVFRSIARGWGMDWTILLNGVLNGRSVPERVLNRVEEVLHSAPYEGPYHFEDGSIPNTDWFGHNRLQRVEGETDPTGERYYFYGAYTGLDYMLLRNLWLLLQ